MNFSRALRRSAEIYAQGWDTFSLLSLAGFVVFYLLAAVLLTHLAPMLPHFVTLLIGRAIALFSIAWPASAIVLAVRDCERGEKFRGVTRYLAEARSALWPFAKRAARELPSVLGRHVGKLLGFLLLIMAYEIAARLLAQALYPPAPTLPRILFDLPSSALQVIFPALLFRETEVAGRFAPA